MKKWALLIVFCLAAFNLKAKGDIDSLFSIIRNQKLSDSVRIDMAIDQIRNLPMTVQVQDSVLIDSLISICTKLKYSKGVINSQLLKAGFLKYINQNNASMELLDEVFSNRKLYKYDKLQSIAHAIKGGNYYCHSQYSKSIECYFKAIDLAVKSGRTNDLTFYYSIIGQIYIELNQLDKAKEFLKNSFDCAIQSDDPKDIGSGLHSVASAYKIIGESDSAIYFLELAHSYYESAQDTIGMYDVLSDISILNIEAGRYEQAIKGLNELLEYDLTVGAELLICQDYQGLAACYFEQKNYGEAEKYVNRSLEYLKGRNAQYELAQAYKIAYQIKIGQKDYKKALEYHIKYKSYYDSLSFNESKEKITFIEKQHHNEQKEIENELLKREQVKNKAIIKHQRVEETFLTFAVLLLALVLIVVFKLYSANKSLTDKLSTANQELSNINKAKDRLFSIISHDLKGPIGTLKGVSELIMKDLEKGGSEKIISRFMPLLHAELEVAYELLNNLLTWAKSQFQLIKLNKTKFLVKAEVNNVIALLKSKGSEKKLEIKNNINEDIEITADPNIFSALLRNLLSNSIKFTPIGGNIEVNIKKEDESIQVSVKDSGVGMTDEVKESVFAKGNHYSSRGTDNERGTGLGLYLCKEFVELHGGRMWVESEPEKGSTFYFSIPQIADKV